MGNPNDVTNLLTTQEAAAILGLTREAISKMVARGALEPIHRIGSFGRGRHGAMLFDRAAIETLAAERAAVKAERAS